MSNDINESDSAASDETPRQNYTLKLLFGPMLGCELHLPADDYFLIINPGTMIQDKSEPVSAIQQHAAHYTLNTLYIPCDIHSPNIVLRLSNPSISENKNGFEYALELHNTVGESECLIKENEVFSYEHIHIAIKRKESPWSEQVMNFKKNSLSADQAAPKETMQLFKNKGRKAILVSLFFFFLLLFAAVSASWYKKVKSEQRVPSLSEALSGAPASLKVLKGRDNEKIFVLSRNLPEMEWATEALHKLNAGPGVVLIWLPGQKNDVVKQLLQDGYPLLQINYNVPQHPVVAVYRHMDPDEENRLKSVMLEKIPFAIDIRIIIRTKSQLLEEARQGLERLHVRYQQIDTSGGYALIIHDRLSDNVLAALSDVIKSFNQKWGSNIVNFSINLDEDWLQNKSYVDDSDGYIFLNPKHWYFPITTK